MVPEENKSKAIGHLPRGHSRYILAKNLAILCSCPDNLSEAEFRSNG